jgi:hypothetical protein
MSDEDGDDSGLGGDEPFCDHGNLLWSEDCDECSDALIRISDAITASEREVKGNEP